MVAVCGEKLPADGLQTGQGLVAVLICGTPSVLGRHAQLPERPESYRLLGRGQDVDPIVEFAVQRLATATLLIAVDEFVEVSRLPGKVMGRKLLLISGFTCRVVH
jgi:hypothetical protein